jgi:hypothetical protein
VADDIWSSECAVYQAARRNRRSMSTTKEKASGGIYVSNRLGWAVILFVVAAAIVITVLSTLLAIVWAQKFPHKVCLDGGDRMFRALLVHEQVARSAGHVPIYDVGPTSAGAGLTIDDSEAVRIYICELLERRVTVEVYLMWGEGGLAMAVFYAERDDCYNEIAELCAPTTAERLVAPDLARFQLQDNASAKDE